MIDIAVAVKTRWNAKSLSTVITGGIHHSRAPERTVMPYCIYTEISDTSVMRSRSSRYNRALIQFDVYDVTPDLVGSHAKRIREAFVNADAAASNPLTMLATTGQVKHFEPDGNPVVMMESDEVFRCMQTFAMLWAESRNLAPAS